MSADDSDLLHGRYYDPAKAHAYYLRTRQLKGRTSAGPTPPAAGGGVARGVQGAARRRNAARRKELEAQKAALEKRLDRLREVLRQLVEAAKKRSGAETKQEKKAATKEASSPKKKADAKPLTAKQKREKAAAAKKAYEKENHGPNMSTEVKQLQRQVQDIRAKIEAAIKDARERSARSKPQTASNGR